MPSDLNLARTYTDAYLFPSGQNIQAWSGQQLISFGQRRPDDGGPPSGLNMLWIDAEGTVRGEQVGDNALLPTHTGFFMTEATPNIVTANMTTFNVAWVESKTDATGTYHVLYFNQLICQ